MQAGGRWNEPPAACTAHLHAIFSQKQAPPLFKKGQKWRLSKYWEGRRTMIVLCSRKLSQAGKRWSFCEENFRGMPKCIIGARVQRTQISWRKLVGDSKATKFVNVFSPSHVFPYTVFTEFLHKSGNLIVLRGMVVLLQENFEIYNIWNCFWWLLRPLHIFHTIFMYIFAILLPI